MPFRRDSRPNPDQIEVIIGPRATFSGQLRCDGSIRLDGTVEGGLIETPANVLITESARVMVDIKARTVSVAGAYKGTINVRTFLLDEGAHFQGQLVMQNAEPADPLLAARPPVGEQIPVTASVSAESPKEDVTSNE